MSSKKEVIKGAAPGQAPNVDETTNSEANQAAGDDTNEGGKDGAVNETTNSDANQASGADTNEGGKDGEGEEKTTAKTTTAEITTPEKPAIVNTKTEVELEAQKLMKQYDINIIFHCPKTNQWFTRKEYAEACNKLYKTYHRE